MNQLFALFYQHIDRTSLEFTRYLYDDIHWESRLIGIVGARGVGKTTLLLQHIKKSFKRYSTDALYVSLDNIWFATHSITTIILK